MTKTRQTHKVLRSTNLMVVKRIRRPSTPQEMREMLTLMEEELEGIRNRMGLLAFAVLSIGAEVKFSTRANKKAAKKGGRK